MATQCSHPAELRTSWNEAASPCNTVLLLDSGKQKRKQKSLVRGAQGGKLLPGEKKRLRKEKIQVRW